MAWSLCLGYLDQNPVQGTEEGHYRPEPTWRGWGEEASQKVEEKSSEEFLEGEMEILGQLLTSWTRGEKARGVKYTLLCHVPCEAPPESANKPTTKI